MPAPMTSPFRGWRVLCIVSAISGGLRSASARRFRRNFVTESSTRTSAQSFNGRGIVDVNSSPGVCSDRVVEFVGVALIGTARTEQDRRNYAEFKVRLPAFRPAKIHIPDRKLCLLAYYA
jgi:hypothetical protein